MIIKIVTILLGNFLFVYVTILKIIYISRKKNLFDEPSEIRKIHLKKTPNLGGIAIFVSVFLSGCLLYRDGSLSHANFIVAGMIILFGLGLTDDLVGVDPLKKIATQWFVAILISSTTNLRLEHGLTPLLGNIQIPYFLSVALTSLFILFLMNAFNLIDGINGLAGSISFFSCIIFSYLFWQLNDYLFLDFSLVLAGCLAGFLILNITPASIFMGDTGSLFIGLMFSLFSIRLLETAGDSFIAGGQTLVNSPLPLIFAMFSIPIFDTLRIFTVRLAKGKSPFQADRNHVHHLLLDTGKTHMQTTGILLMANLSVFLIACLLSSINTLLSIIIIAIYVQFLFAILWYGKRNIKEPAYIKTHPRTYYAFKPRKVLIKKTSSAAKKL